MQRIHVFPHANEAVLTIACCLWLNMRTRSALTNSAIGARASAEPQASVLNPTRELASQKAQVIKTLGICTMKMMMMMIELILCCAAQYSRLALDKRYWITSSGIVGVHCFVIDHVFFVQCMRHRCWEWLVNMPKLIHIVELCKGSNQEWFFSQGTLLANMLCKVPPCASKSSTNQMSNRKKHSITAYVYQAHEFTQLNKKL